MNDAFSPQVLIIGAGPCGLRAAIDAAFLGARVSVIEMRQHVTRNNCLHLWPFVIDDLKKIGIKIFHPKFCSGGIDHISMFNIEFNSFTINDFNKTFISDT